MVFLCYGTRPEIIKMAPVAAALSELTVPHRTVFTGQHPDLYRDVADLMPPPDFHLEPPPQGLPLAALFSHLLLGLERIFLAEKPRLVVAQGDTNTVLAAAMAAHFQGIPFGHIEAGLRTHDLQNPWPEEGIRQQVSRLAAFHWAPTEQAMQNLRAEGITQGVTLTGNTIVDACRAFHYPISYGTEVLVTLHRRENFGTPLQNLLAQIEALAVQHPDLQFIFPMHPNPQVQRLRESLRAVQVVAPMPYSELLRLLSRARFVVSDSGGIQEECAVFQKKILVCRKITERPEGVEAGFARLVGHDVAAHFDWANQSPVWQGQNPYGDGQAGRRIAEAIRASG